jgi:hypothetical protein
LATAARRAAQAEKRYRGGASALAESILERVKQANPPASLQSG